jgi:hypothetical protein
MCEFKGNNGCGGHQQMDVIFFGSENLVHWKHVGWAALDIYV